MKHLVDDLRALIAGVSHPLVNLANAAALIYGRMPDVNWAGFYLLDRGMLRLAPFGGKPACTDIAPERGVCGAAFSRGETLVVPDVHAFPGHIACDAASRSEIVVPLRPNGRVVGVLDLDSPKLNRFTEDDRALLEQIVALLEEGCDWSRLGYDLSFDAE